MGESLEQALNKEAFEEIGLRNFTARHLKTYIWECAEENELVYMFVSYDYKNFKVLSGEVDEVRFWTKNQIENHLEKGEFTPNFEKEFAILKELKIL